MPSFTSRAVFQQLTGCKFDGSVTDSINFDVFFRSLPAGDHHAWRPPLCCVMRVNTCIMSPWLGGLGNHSLCSWHLINYPYPYIHCNSLLTKKTPVTDKSTKINPGMAPEKYYHLYLVSIALPLTATTHFLADRTGNDTGNLNGKSLTCKWPVIRLPCKLF